MAGLISKRKVYLLFFTLVFSLLFVSFSLIAQTAKAWGLNEYGQLGEGSNNRSNIYGSSSSAVSKQKITIKVVLVGSDLSVKPVPKRTFSICSLPECKDKVNLTTSLEGEIVIALPPGEYKISSINPVDFEGKKYSWSVKFNVGEAYQTSIELSNDNATISESESMKSLSQGITDEGKVYEKVKDSVFTIESESGHGSGFLVDKLGLVITNNHVVKGSEYLAVKTTATTKFPASLIVTDELNDIAIIRVNPEAFKDLQPLELAADSVKTPAAIVGQRVVAVGSPLSTENILTIGIVSKIEKGVIFSDVNINQGNSGGPLFDLTGKVIGINTFGLSGSSGPGISGIVRIYLANSLLEKAKELLNTMPCPPYKKLPVESSYHFPADTLRKIANSEQRKEKDYHMEVGALDVQFITPVLISCLQVENEKKIQKAHNKRTQQQNEYIPGKDFYAWQRYAGDYRAVVIIQVIPEIGMTGGSIFRLIAFGGDTSIKYHFKTDFKKMELLRDDTIVEPILPGRIPDTVDVEEGNVSMRDYTYYGSYEYPPEAFKPGATLTLKIWEEKRDKPRIVKIPEKTVQQIWRDYKPYFDAIEQEAKGQSES